jgi:hypothetical protein
MRNLSMDLYKIGTLPTEELREAILLLANEVSKEERKLFLQRNRTRKCREKRYSNNVTVTVRDGNVERYGNGHNLLKDNEQRYGNGSENGHIYNILDSSYRKEDRKEERKKGGAGGKEEGGKGRRKTLIPVDLACSDKNVADAIRIGIPEEIIATEWQKFHDHHLAKGTPGVDWNAGWRTWCRKHLDYAKDKSQSHAKPLSFRQATIIGNRRMLREQVAAAEALENPLGSPPARLVSPNGNAANVGNDTGNGGDYGGLFGKSFG